MPEYLAPAVYVEEVDTGSKPIEGVSTSTAGMLGVTERGPVNVPILITSAGEYRRWFGELLEIGEFSNGQDHHCFLPYAVDGFFTNGGKRVYVTRIESSNAWPSMMRLYNRGVAGGVETMLLRAAAAGTGTAVNGPTVAITEPGGLGNGDTIRIGDGSSAEYRTIVGALAPARDIPLTFPLTDVHAAGMAGSLVNFGRVVEPAPGAAALRTLVAVQPGAVTVTLQGAAALDATNLAAGQLIEFGGANGEHRVITFAGPVGGAGGDTLDVTLDSPLVNAYPAVVGPATNVVRLVYPPIAPPAVGANQIGNPTQLTAQTLPGDALIFGDTLGGSFAAGSLVQVIDTHTEVRSIGALRRLTLNQGAYDEYPAGARVDRFAATAQVFATTAATAGATLTLNGVAGLAPGQTVVIDPAGAATVGVIQSVNAGANTITLTAPPVPPPGVGINVQLRRRLTAGVPAGSATLPLSNRVGVGVGDILLLGAAGAQEFVEVAGILDPVGLPPNAGTIVLAAPTRLGHALNDDLVLQALAPAGGAADRPAYIALAQQPGARTTFVSSDPGFAANDVLRIQLPGARAFYHTLNGVANVNPQEAVLDTPLSRTHEMGSVVAQRAALIEITALDTGHWGDRLRISVEDEDDGLVSGTTATGTFGANQLVVTSLNGIETGTVLEMRRPAAAGGGVVGPLMKVIAVDRNNGRVTLDAPLDPLHIAAIPAPIRSIEFYLAVRLMRRPDALVPARDETVIALEEYHNLSMDPRHSRYICTAVGDVNAPLRISDRRPDGNSWFVRARELNAGGALAIRRGPETLTDVLPSGETRAARHALEGGRDGIAMLGDADYIGTDANDPENRTGLFSLQNIEEISIVAVPGRTSAQMQNALIAHCELMRYRFAVLDGPQPDNDLIADVRAQRQQFDTRYAALYHPWLSIPQPFPAPHAPTVFNIPPSGQVVGVYARTDIERGVHKAPANEVVRGITGLRRSLSQSEQDILNPYPVNINVIRDFRKTNRGIRIWGGRVITSDSDWKYVNVRRLLIFIEASIDRGLQWVVFEPNAEPLWARVRRSISNFLRVVWRNGALEGTKPEEAFFVRCDRTTMTQAEIDNGQLIVLVGVAPVKPAEFVIVRIGLWTAHTDD